MASNILYGSVIGHQFMRNQQLNFLKCKFIHNAPHQDVSMSRQTKYEKDYFICDGCVFQIGYSCSLNDVNLLFQECQFNNNYAYHHGCDNQYK